ncbi:MAG: hypothetical protein ABI811_24375 [Acidobacteriota bacterium]
MAIRTTVDIPEPLHHELRKRAQQTGTSMRALIVQSLDQTFGAKKKGKRITGPLVKGKGKLGPLFPVDENPYDLLLP